MDPYLQDGEHKLVDPAYRSSECPVPGVVSTTYIGDHPVVDDRLAVTKVRYVLGQRCRERHGLARGTRAQG